MKVESQSKKVRRWSTLSVVLAAAAGIIVSGSAAALVNSVSSSSSPTPSVASAKSGCSSTTTQATSHGVSSSTTKIPLISSGGAAQAEGKASQGIGKASQVAYNGSLAAYTSALAPQAQTVAITTFNPQPFIFTGIYPTAGLPSGGNSMTISGIGFGQPGNFNVWPVFDFGQFPNGTEDLVPVASTVVSNTEIYVPSVPPSQNNSNTAYVMLATPDSYVLTTTIPWQLIGFSAAAVYTYTNNPPPTTTSTSSTTTTSFPPASIAVPAVIPTVEGINPPAGLPTGGAPVSIEGTGFNGTTQVLFGNTAASTFTVVSPGLITTVSPPGSGVVDIRVINPQGESAPTSMGQFSYSVNIPAIRVGSVQLCPPTTTIATQTPSAASITTIATQTPSTASITTSAPVSPTIVGRKS